MTVELLRAVAVLQGVLLAGLGSAVVALEITRMYRQRRDPPRLERARRALAAAVRDETATGADLLAAPWRLRLQAFADLAPNLKGAGRGRLAALAVQAGLHDGAARCCRSRRWTRRLRGVRVFMVIGAGADVVAPLLTDPHPEVRAEAAAWAAEHPSPPVLDRVVELLGDDHPRCRFNAKNTLLHVGHPAVGPVARLLADPPQARLPELLEFAVGLADPSFLPAVSQATAHADPAVRARAARLAAAVGGAVAVSRLRDLLDDPVADVRAAAATGLSALGDWAAAPALAAALRDPTWEARWAAGCALAALGATGRLYLRWQQERGDGPAADVARRVLDASGAA